MKRGICFLVAGGLMFLGPAALAAPRGQGIEQAHGHHNDDDHDGWREGKSHYGHDRDDDRRWHHTGGCWGDCGYGGEGESHYQPPNNGWDCQYNGCYQQNDAYSRGYSDGYRAGTAYGQHDCGYRDGYRNAGPSAQDDYHRGYADGYSAAYKEHCG